MAVLEKDLLDLKSGRHEVETKLRQLKSLEQKVWMSRLRQRLIRVRFHTNGRN